MPTQKPRVAVTLSDEARAALNELAEATGKAPSTVAAELLGEMTQQMRDLAKIARHLKAGRKGAAKSALQHMVGNAMAEVIADAQPSLPLKGKK